MMIELTKKDGTKFIANNIDGIWPSPNNHSIAVVSITGLEPVNTLESYDEIKAKLRQQKVNELAERLFVKLTDSGCDYPLEAAFQEAEKFITEMEKRNGNT